MTPTGAQARARPNWAATSRVIAVASTTVVTRVPPASRYRRAVAPPNHIRRLAA